MELNAEQIKKALECCANRQMSCNNCPYVHEDTADDGSCAEKMEADALALITSQEQRIKELEVELKAMRGAANAYKMHITELTQAHEMLSESYDHLEKTKDELLAERSRLTEELQKLKKVKYIFSTVDYCADDLAKALEENKKLTEEAENWRIDAENYRSELAEVRAESKKWEESYDCMHSACRELSDKCDRLTEENERLRGIIVEVKKRIEHMSNIPCEIQTHAKNLRADTVREFTERLKKDFLEYKHDLTLTYIDKIAKEMLEDKPCT